MNRIREHVFKDRRELAAALARRLAADLGGAVRKRGRAGLAVSGGRTPVELFDRLSRQHLDWSSIWVTLTDERWVSPGHSESNERLVRTWLLNGPATRAHFVPLKNDADTPEAGQAASNEALRVMPVPLDIVLLGMGEDGHTASLFPNAPELPDLLTSAPGIRCHPVNPGSGARPRMSLTLPFLLTARHIYLHIEGEAKRTVYVRALEQCSVNEMPIRAIFQQKSVHVEMYWAP